MLISPRIRVLLAGVASQILCVGIARFSYTPLLPLMQEQTWLGDAAGGWLAAVNYLGYISGAVLAASINNLQLKDTLYRIGLVLGVLSTAAMAITENLTLWVLLRYVAGLASAASMLLASGLILNWLIRNGHRGELGIHFAGIGLGIVVASVAVELMLQLQQNWAQQWLWFAGLGIFFAVPAWRWLPRPQAGNLNVQGQSLVDNPPTKRFMYLMLGAYFCAGYGYVVTATFIVAFVERQPELSGMGAITFVLLGLAAVPAVVVWDLVARYTGYLNALLLTLILQVGGIVIPVLCTNLWAVLFSAMLFGGTFVGSVSLVLTMAGRLYPTKPAKLMGKMTLAYGSAQVLAPAITGMLTASLGSYNLGLWLAGGFVVLSAGLVVWLKFTDSTIQNLDLAAKQV